MRNDAARLEGTPRRCSCGRILAEAAGVTLLGVLIALVANQFSPRGLSLTRDYFPASSSVGEQARGITPAAGNSAIPNSTHSGQVEGAGSLEHNAVTARLEALGLRRVDHEEAAALFRDPRYETEQVLFVDARNDAAYAEGHIPSAYQLDHYYPERYLAEVLPACQLAEVIVVYCTGGECEDSESTAVLLKNTGIPADRLRVYLGGIHEWAAKGMPQETGPRRSGILKAQGP